MVRSALRRAAGRLSVCLVAGVASIGCASPPTALAPGQPAVLQDDEGIALRGYDPVAYFTDGGPRRGEPGLRATHDGATYLFASAENRDAFLADPERYAPAFGGWCAWALADGEGSLVKIDPKSYLIQDERLFLFFDGFLADTRAWWLERNVDELGESADRNWERIAGE
ncbi:MAG: YHS domain-containing (seleno)protein [Planctomycetota bacterium]